MTFEKKWKVLGGVVLTLACVLALVFLLKPKPIKVAKVAPATDSIKQVIEESEPVPVVAPNFTTKTVRCELNGGRCWDQESGRYVDLGESR